MTIDLDNSQSIQDQDHLGVLDATNMLWQQCQQAWQETQPISLPDSYKDITNVVIAGMGGSHLGAQLINSVYNQHLTIPLLIQHEYHAPGFVNRHTLFIATSFSGTTEEVLTQIQTAEEKGAKIICISSGGDLAQLAQEKNYPHYVFKSTHNPSKIPRYGSGYLFISQLAFLAKAGVIQFDQSHVDQAIDAIKQADAQFNLNNQTSSNQAKQFAQSLQSQAVVLVSSQHLTGSAYISKNQINESAKHFSTLFTLPELNHHLLEGLAHPSTNPDHLTFIFIESDLYHPRVQARYPITQEIIKKQNFNTLTYKPQSGTQLEQAFETLTFTSYVAIYLSILNQVDPGPNPWVDHLKDELKKLN